MAELSCSEWETFLTQFPEAHILQTPAWGELKSHFGWEPRRTAAGEAGAQVLFRRLPLGLSLAYLPKGPLGEQWDALWPEVDALCRSEKAVFLKVEPDAWDGAVGTGSFPNGFLPGQPPIQPRSTLVVDLSGTEDEVLARMKQKTRYNIHLAAKKGVEVRCASDTAEFSRMMALTGVRDGFAVHAPGYYQRAYEAFSLRGECALLTAEYGGQTLAGLMVFRRGDRAWYFYGASTDAERNRMPTYLLQWEAMRWAREHGCREYDLWGVPDASAEALEAQFEQRADGLWGVYRFKRGFGGALRRSAGAWDRVYNPLLYRFYQLWVSRGAAGVD